MKNINIGEIKTVTYQGRIIGCYTLRDDGCYEVCYLNKFHTFKSLAFDELLECKAFLKKKWKECNG